jgi:hypothetical protein
MLGLGNALSTGSVHEQMYSLSLDGTGDYLSIGNVLDLGTADFSLSIWIKLADWDGAHYRVFTKYEDANNYWMLQKDGNGSIIFSCKGDDGDSDEILTNTGTTNDTSTTNDGNWVHICISADRDGNIIWYKNGSAVKTLDISGTAKEAITLNNAGEMRIGSQATNGAFDVLGNLDEAAIWNVALDADAVAGVYNSGKPFNLNNDRGNYDNSSALQGYWRMFNGPFDDKVNGVVHDASNPGYGDNYLTGSWSGASGGWSTTTGGIVNSGTNGLFYHVLEFTDFIGSTYKLEYTLSSVTDSSTLKFKFGGGSSIAIGGTNGDHIKYLVSDATVDNIQFVSEGDWAGTITNISLKKLNGHPGIVAADATYSTDTPDD